MLAKKTTTAELDWKLEQFVQQATIGQASNRSKETICEVKKISTTELNSNIEQCTHQETVECARDQSKGTICKTKERTMSAHNLDWEAGQQTQIANISCIGKQGKARSKANTSGAVYQAPVMNQEKEGKSNT